MWIFYFFIGKTFAFIDSDPFFESAMQKLENGRFQHVGEIVELLEKSAGMFNMAAFYKLGEFWLFGYRDVENGIQRNYTKAYEYFVTCALGSNFDCQFFVNLIRSESWKNKEIEIGFLGDQESIRKSMVKAAFKGSSLANAGLFAAIARKNKLENIRIPEEFVRDKENSEVFAPYLKKNNCVITEEIVEVASEEAKKASKIIEDLGVNYKFKSIEFAQDTLYGEASLKSLELLLKTSEKYLDPNGFFHLGVDFFYGNLLKGIPKSVEQGVRYLERAFELGSPHAAALLGKISIFGLNSFDKNIKKGLNYLEKAISLGSVEAISIKSHLFRNAIGVEKDLKKAFHYAKKAADLGNIESLNDLGIHYLNGEGVEKNIDLAFKYASKSAQQGFVSAKINLGHMFFNKKLEKYSLEIAFEVFAEVVSEGISLKYMINAHVCYKNNDYTGAYLNYLVAAELGNAKALLSLAYFFDQSLIGNCRKNKEYCAGIYLLRAIASDEKQAAYEKMGKILYNQNNYFLAYHYFVNTGGTAESSYYLAYMNEEGQGCDQDFEKALQIYESTIIRARHNLIDSKAFYPAFLGKLRTLLKYSLSFYFPISFSF